MSIGIRRLPAKGGNGRPKGTPRNSPGMARVRRAASMSTQDATSGSEARSVRVSSSERQPLGLTNTTSCRLIGRSAGLKREVTDAFRDVAGLQPAPALLAEHTPLVMRVRQVFPPAASPADPPDGVVPGDVHRSSLGEIHSPGAPTSTLPSPPVPRSRASSPWPWTGGPLRREQHRAIRPGRGLPTPWRGMPPQPNARRESHGRPPMNVRMDEALGEMGEELVQAEKLVALAHALAVAVDETKSGRCRGRR